MSTHSTGAAVTCSCLGGLSDESQIPCLESIGYNRVGVCCGEPAGHPATWQSLQPLSIFLQRQLALEEAVCVDSPRGSYAATEQGVPPATPSTPYLQGFKTSIWN